MGEEGKAVNSNDKFLSENTRNKADYFEASQEFSERLRFSLCRKTKPSFETQTWMRYAAMILLPLVTLSIALPMHTRSIQRSEFTNAVIDAHIRSTLAKHLMDVESTDQHTVKPWFLGKIDFSPPVGNYAEQGFPLGGGRLEYILGRPAAALVYERAKHMINLFVLKKTNLVSEASHIRNDGFEIFEWQEGDFSFVAISDLNQKEFGEFIHLVQSR
ncbi:MAG: putative anti-sigma factor [Bacteriovoracaceae bacterium]|nr:putative anti-sigma factor [Bacteriovoracaceae bacterium]